MSSHYPFWYVISVITGDNALIWSPGSVASQHPVSAAVSPRLLCSALSSGCNLHPSLGRHKSVRLYLSIRFIPHVHCSRMQTLGSERLSTLAVIRNSITLSGVPSLYAGLSASLLRQLSYSLVRLGAYERFKAYLSRDRKLSPAHILFAACLAGGLGGLAGNPAGLSCLCKNISSSASHPGIDIILVRMTSDLVRPPEKRYAYSNALAGLVRLIRNEHLQGLARGLGTNTVCHSFVPPYLLIYLLQFRAVLMNVRSGRSLPPTFTHQTLGFSSGIVRSLSSCSSRPF